MTMSKEIADGFRQVAADQITQDIENSSKFATKASLATVATSGSYNDLTDKPDSSVTRLVHSVTGITLSSGTALAVPTYTMGSNLLAVYFNGLLLSKDVEYSEVSSTSIAFTFDITTDDLVEVICYSGSTSSGTGTMTTAVDVSRSAVISAGTAYTVADHTVGENRLTVYLDGLQYTDFSETSRTSIVFDVDIPATMSIVVNTNNL